MRLLDVRNLSVYYSTRRGAVKAVDGISFDLQRGEVVGLAGESGCGKTTVAMSILGIIPPPGRIVHGHILLDGIDLAGLSPEEMRKIRWKRISMVFQSAMNSLNPVLPVGEQIAESIVTHQGTTWGQGLSLARRLLEQMEIDPSRTADYPHEFSGGMKQRVVIAMALACNPDLIIADEPTTALDVLVQASVLRRLMELRREMNISMILISHDLSIIAHMCDRVAVMYAGKIVEYSTTKNIFSIPKHPYTQMLIQAFPSIKARKKFVSIPGVPPDPLNLPSGCSFHPRCPYVFERCLREEPGLLKVADAHVAKCHLAEEMSLIAK